MSVMPAETLDPYVPRANPQQVTVYDLHWLDMGILEAKEEEPVVSFERVRRFPHLGAAIAWARRQIFHGKIYGDAIELISVSRLKYDDTPEVMESEVNATEITLAGFQRWERITSSTYSTTKDGLTLKAPSRRCGTE